MINIEEPFKCGSGIQTVLNRHRTVHTTKSELGVGVSLRKEKRLTECTALVHRTEKQRRFSRKVGPGQHEELRKRYLSRLLSLRKFSQRLAPRKLSQTQEGVC